MTLFFTSNPSVKPYLKHAFFYLTAPFYRGEKVECPICGGHFRKFLVAGVNKRANARCPRCGALERHRLFWLYAQPLLTGPLKILHIAPEYFLQRRLRKLPSVDYLSADLKSPLAMAKFDVTDMPLEADTFDIALCSHVLEHVADDREAMREIFRVLKPGGWAYLQSPVDKSRAVTLEDATITTLAERRRIFGQADHVRLYGRDYVDRLAEVGFDVKIEAYAATFSAEQIAKYGLDVDDDLYLGVKPMLS
jgi:SAM-dependent methyltransferase